MKIFDSLTQNFIEIPNENIGRKIKLFVCGPTVYDYPHIGHARTYIAFDVVARWLRARGFKVFYMQNITDVDDKIINRAKESKLIPKEIADKFEKEYHYAEKILNIKSVNKYPKASEHIPEIIDQIKRLIEKGFAYETDDGIYFDITKFEDYGKLSRQNIEQMVAGARIELNENKKNPVDFALWKKTLNQNIKPAGLKKFQIVKGEPLWKSPWGWGRPGWHIEDTAITEKYFGPQYEIHGGASELKFPHHEAEIAQEESVSGIKPMVKIWMHTGVLLVGGKKMSKSLKNFITIIDFVEKYGADALRFMILRNHYRSPVDYSDKLAKESLSSYMSIIKFLKKLSFVDKNKKKLNLDTDKKMIIDLNKYNEKFMQSLDDDFNTPKAISVLFSLINDIDKNIFNLESGLIKDVGKFISSKLNILGFSNTSSKYIIPNEIKRIAKERESARSNAQFTRSDALRIKIEQLGYTIEDTPIGQFIYKKYEQS